MSRAQSSHLGSHLDRKVRSIESIDKAYSRTRTIAFIIFAALAVAASRTGASAAWVWVAVAIFAVFLFLVFAHQSVRARLRRWRDRVQLQDQLAALQALKPLQPLNLRGLEVFESSHRVRDLDLLQPHGWVSLFPFFLTQAGRRAFVNRLTEKNVSRSAVLERQKSVRFWTRARVRRRSLLRLSNSLDAVVDTDELKVASQFALSELPIGRLRKRVLVLLGLHVALIACFPLGLIGLPKGVALGALIALFAAYGFFAQQLDLLQAYPRAMLLGRSMRVLAEVVKRLSYVSKSSGANSFGAEPLVLLQKIERAAGMLGVRQNPLLALLINILIPWDFYWSVQIEGARRDVALHLEDWLTAIASLETDLALAEWSAAHGQSWPEFSGVGMNAVGLVHPMLSPTKRVANPLTLDASQRCHLITGSNMAGKSTFLRAIGMNVLLAQAGAAVPSEKLVLEPLQLETSLRPSDSLEDGFSSFYSEVADLVEILSLANRQGESAPVLYLIDEIFRGTNNRERRLGAESVIRALAQSRAFGLVTTHDLDLAALEGSVKTLRNHHFRDDVKDGVMTFSYQYKIGACPSTNAVKVMRSAGLPIVED